VEWSFRFLLTAVSIFELGTEPSDHRTGLASADCLESIRRRSPLAGFPETLNDSGERDLGNYHDPGR
jgi:hypothetical protein